MSPFCKNPLQPFCKRIIVKTEGLGLLQKQDKKWEIFAKYGGFRIGKGGFMGHFHHFKMGVYCTAQTLSRLDEKRLEQEWTYLEKYVGIDKVYLETYRGGTTVDAQRMRMFLDFFHRHGVETAGGITTVVPDLSDGDKKRQRLFGTYCYSNPAMRDHLKQISEYTAGLFDEFILDDFFFTSCRCEDCIREKGGRTWKAFRAAKMEEVSRNLILEPARKVNPNVKVTVKYPNWRESYHETGYIPMRQRELFDYIYTGTETRNTEHTDQHLPHYLSYSLMRYMENAAPGRNRGGWFDTYECWPIDCYLEQGYLTAFSRPQEITLFQWGDLFANKLVTPLGIQLAKIDWILERAGQPVGVPTYIPFASCGENHLEDHLGMQGIALEPSPEFPENGDMLFLTEAAASDEGILQKLEAFLLAGGTAIVTTGFVGAVSPEGWEKFSTARLTGRKLSADRYQVTEDPAGYYRQASAITFPELQFGNNASWSCINAGSGDSHSSLLLLDTYGKGKLFTLAVPDMFAAFSSLPVPVMDPIRRAFAAKDVYISGQNVSLFQYDNDIFVLYCYAGKDSRPQTVSVHLLRKAARLCYLNTDREVLLTPRICRHQGWKEEELVGQVLVQPGDFYAFSIES